MSLKIFCAICGAQIRSGVYCNACQQKLLRQARRISEKKAFHEQMLLLEEERRRTNLILIASESIRDSEFIAQIISENISTHGVVVMNDFDKIMNIIHSMKVRLALIDDSVTKNFNGLKILKTIRDDYIISNTPVIITANRNDDIKKSIAMRLAAYDYIAKPFNFTKFIERISEILAEENSVRITLSKILLIDDIEDDAETEKEILEKNFYCTVFTADNGIEGMEILQDTDKINLIFINLEMLFMDGFRVLKFIRQHSRFADIPAIFLSNSDNFETIKRIKSSSAVGYVNKPKFSSESIDFIKKVLMKGR